MAGRLLESTNMIKELLQANRQLREIIDKKTGELDKSQNEVVRLQLENQDLNEKVDVLTKLMKPPDEEDILNLNPRELFSDDLRLQIAGGDKLLHEVIELRKANKSLEEQLKYTTMKPTTFPMLKPTDRTTRILHLN